MPGRDDFVERASTLVVGVETSAAVWARVACALGNEEAPVAIATINIVAGAPRVLARCPNALGQAGDADRRETVGGDIQHTCLSRNGGDIGPRTGLST